MKNNEVDVLLIGGGIMSATLGVLLHQLNPELSITMVEKLSDVALESSDALNNAGTGHAGYCELNYTPQSQDGKINIERALEINSAYEISLQLWSSLVKLNILPPPKDFISKTPHLSFVWGEENIKFLEQRYLLLKQHHLFESMQFSTEFEQLKTWMPLIMQDRDASSPCAATYVEHGSDVNFGALTRHLVAYLKKQTNFTLLTGTKLNQIKKVKKKIADERWHVTLADTSTKKTTSLKANFVFLGAGGGTLPLLQKTGVAECEGYGGFPVSGQWLICNNKDVIKQHQTKVYGKAAVNAPPMSVPHLDTRMINGEPALLFGPFAGFTTKFLKTGSKLDLAKSIKSDNIKAMLSVGKNNSDLTKYLVKEATQTHEQRMETLRTFLPQAKNSDWSLAQAGQRVQVIKKSEKKWGKLEFGTEIVCTKDRSLAALLGASPGASVSANVMLEIVERCFPEQMQTKEWQKKLTSLIPSYNQSLIENKALLAKVRKRDNTVLHLN